jgi:hypothetical protein
VMFIAQIILFWALSSITSASVLTIVLLAS